MSHTRLMFPTWMGRVLSYVCGGVCGCRAAALPDSAQDLMKTQRVGWGRRSGVMLLSPEAAHLATYKSSYQQKPVLRGRAYASCSGPGAFFWNSTFCRLTTKHRPPCLWLLLFFLRRQCEAKFGTNWNFKRLGKPLQFAEWETSLLLFAAHWKSTGC